MDLYLVELPVADIEASLAWYRDRLGLPVILTDAANKYALLAAGPARIALKQRIDKASGAVVTFRVEDLDAELARLARHDITPERPIRVSAEGYRSARMHDPDGNALDLFEWVRPALSR
jgi:catechol 2,3-dioxygenase-like lactoylglutathione lyase family enzyme